MHFSYNSFFFSQRRVYKTTETVPDKLTDVLDVETFSKAKSYGIDKNTFSIAEEWFNMIVSTVSTNIDNVMTYVSHLLPKYINCILVTVLDKLLLRSNKITITYNLSKIPVKC